MDTGQAKWFLRVFEGGNKLNTTTIRELYLSGYIGIELLTPGKDPLPTVITEKGKRVLETPRPRLHLFFESRNWFLRFHSALASPNCR
jgi:hypothetical protein